MPCFRDFRATRFFVLPRTNLLLILWTDLHLLDVLPAASALDLVDDLPGPLIFLLWAPPCDWHLVVLSATDSCPTPAAQILLPGFLWLPGLTTRRTDTIVAGLICGLAWLGVSAPRSAQIECLAAKSIFRAAFLPAQNTLETTVKQDTPTKTREESLADL